MKGLNRKVNRRTAQVLISVSLLTSGFLLGKHGEFANSQEESKRLIALSHMERGIVEALPQNDSLQDPGFARFFDERVLSSDIMDEAGPILETYTVSLSGELNHRYERMIEANPKQADVLWRRLKQLQSESFHLSDFEYTFASRSWEGVRVLCSSPKPISSQALDYAMRKSFQGNHESAHQIRAIAQPVIIAEVRRICPSVEFL